MTDIALVILTKNEKLHIARCLNRAAHLQPKQVFVIDCGSTDGTVEIAKSHGATVIHHDWPGNQALQFNWALETIPIEAGWILRLDADEYLYPETMAEVREVLPKLPSRFSSISMERDRYFFGKHIKHGTRGVVLLRFFRKGMGRSAYALMDEHIVTDQGEDYLLEGHFVDDNLNPLSDWTLKHVGYARREAVQAMSAEAGGHGNKNLYYKVPKYLRCFIYFCWRYFARGGFLDGTEGFLWHFLQAFWYRALVDAMIMEIERKANCGRYYGSWQEKVKQALVGRDGS